MRLPGRLRSSLIIGLQGIRARKLRTVLSMLSLFLGVLAVVVVQAGAETAKRALLSNVELTLGVDGTRQAFLTPQGDTAAVAVDVLSGRTDAVLMAGATGIIGEPGVSPVNVEGGSYTCDRVAGTCTKTEAGPTGQAIQLNVTGLSGDIRPYRPFRPVAGRWLDFASAPSLAPRLVLNRAAAKQFTEHRVPAQLHLDGAIADATPRIIGVIDDGMEDPNAYVRLDELLSWLPASELSAGIQVLLPPGRSDAEQILRSRLAATGVPADVIHVETVNSRKHVESELALVRLIFLGMAGLVLLIGVAGILNVGLATVGERVEEFALRRAVGTPRTLLAGIVLSETLFTGLLTAGAAIGVAAVSLRYVGMIIGTRQPTLRHLDFPWQAGVAGVIAGLLAGLLGGLVPAIRAARIPIATVMRA
jgi:putative ABC transport system permease protein